MTDEIIRFAIGSIDIILADYIIRDLELTIVAKYIRGNLFLGKD